MQTTDTHQLIMDEIGKIDGDKKYAGESVLVCCPLPDHFDNSPSCGIYIAAGMEIPLGYWHCFGCGEKGHWNDLARQAGLQQIEDWKLRDAAQNSVSSMGMLFDKADKKIKSYRSLDGLMKALKRPSFIPWPTDVDWRTFNGKLVQDAGAVMNFQHTGTSVCFFPCTAGSRYIGGVAAYLTKQMNGTSYVNTQGEWSKAKGLFPLALVKRCLKKYKLRYVVLVEGPRDALAMLALGIPALAVLGAEQFGKGKRMIIESLDLTHVFSLMDNDKGGKTARARLKAEFDSPESYVKYVPFRFPEDKDENGKLIKIDPAIMSQELASEIKRAIKKAVKSKGRTFLPVKSLDWRRVEDIKVGVRKKEKPKKKSKEKAEKPMLFGRKKK